MDKANKKSILLLSSILIVFACMMSCRGSGKSKGVSANTTSTFVVHTGRGSGLIDLNGDLKFETNHQLVGNFFDGVAPAIISPSGNVGFINRSNEIVIKPEFESAYEFRNGFAVVSQSNGMEAVIDINGNYVSDRDFSMIAGYFQGPAICERNGLRGYIARNGDLVVPPKYEDAGFFKEGLASVKMGDKWGFIDDKGNLVIEAKYDYGSYLGFSEGLADVNIGGTPVGKAVRGGKWGFINRHGQMVIAPAYDEVLPFSEGLAAASRDGLWGYIDVSGQFVILPQFKAADSFSEGLAAVEDDHEKWGYIDHSGNFRIKPKFAIAENFDKGAANVSVSTLNPFKYDRMLINLEGNTIWEFK